MKHTRSSERLRMLSCLPRNMLQMHGSDNMSEFVLHNLCCKDCFNLRKAAYFVDNPAFNCLKGVVGYDEEEAYTPHETIWSQQEAFSEHMKKASFNQRVRNCIKYSCKNCETPDEHIMQSIAKDLGMNNFNYCTWNMKYDNHGYLIYQPNDNELEHDEFLNGLTLLAFCPVF